MAGIIFTASAAAQEIIPLYDLIPNSIPGKDREQSVTKDGVERLNHVSVPLMMLYRPAVTTNKMPAVIICPGGSYSILSIAKEGKDVAQLFSEWGVMAFVLKYRLPDDTIMVDRSIGPLQDAQRAIQMIREYADKWNIDTAKIGLMGFSAGGHLASSGATHFKNAVISNDKNISLRPSFSILVYPVISFADSITHMGSRTNLLGKNPSAEKISYWSNELQVNPQTPPTFIVHASDDKAVLPANSINYYMALLKNKVPAEMHIYQNGGHGFGMNNKTTTEKWMERLKNWLVSNKIVKE